MILILGPNGVGKTKIAYELARRRDGEVINLDRTYLYKGLPIATGLSDALKEQEVDRHLYELLEPDQAAFSTEAFVKMVCQKNSEIGQRQKLTIAEGASTVYVPALLELHRLRPLFQKIIGLRFTNSKTLKEKYLARIDHALNDGLVAEIQANLERFEKTFLMQQCHAAVPIVKYLKGELTLKNAKNEIFERCWQYQELQLALFSQFHEVEWIETNGFDDAYINVTELLTSPFQKSSSLKCNQMPKLK